MCPLWSSLATETLQWCQGTQGKQNISIKVFYFTRLTASCQWIIPWSRKKCLQRFIRTTPAQAWREGEGNDRRGHPAGIPQFSRKLCALTQLHGRFLSGKIVAYLKSRQPGTRHQETLILSPRPQQVAFTTRSTKRQGMTNGPKLLRTCPPYT